MSRRRASTALLWSLTICACSHVRHVYEAPLAVRGSQEVKRVAIAAWAPSDHPSLEPALTAVATDYLKLRKNFLAEAAPDAGAARSHWQAACTDKTEGVMLVRALSASLSASVPSKTRLLLAAELYRCHDGAILFRSEGELTRKEDDPSLLQMRKHYEEQLGVDKGPYVPCAFSLLQQMLSPIYDPALTDAELEEKIELGRVATSAPHAPLACRL